MRISLIGAGRVAFHLGKILAQQHDLVQVYSRNFDKAQALAKNLNCQAIAALHLLDSQVDLIIIAVSDQAIATLIAQLHQQVPDVCIVHTSGSTDINVLSAVHARAGVFYPLQTFSFEREIDWQQTPVFVEASTAHDQAVLLQLAKSLSQRVYAYSSAQRLSLHMAAVFACNFSNYCYDMAKQILDDKQVDFSLLYPLILETAHKATENPPVSMQTGPAMRADQAILAMHQEMLTQAQRTDFAQAYEVLSAQILKRHQERP